MCCRRCRSCRASRRCLSMLTNRICVPLLSSVVQPLLSTSVTVMSPFSSHLNLPTAAQSKNTRNLQRPWRTGPFSIPRSQIRSWYPCAPQNPDGVAGTCIPISDILARLRQEAPAACLPRAQYTHRTEKPKEMPNSGSSYAYHQPPSSPPFIRRIVRFCPNTPLKANSRLW